MKSLLGKDTEGDFEAECQNVTNFWTITYFTVLSTCESLSCFLDNLYFTKQLPRKGMVQVRLMCSEHHEFLFCHLKLLSSFSICFR